MLTIIDMKKLLLSAFYITLLLIPMLNQQALSATWRNIDKNENFEYAFDQDSIISSEKNKQISIKVNVLKDPKEGDKSRLLRFSINCINSTLLLEEIKRYSELELKGVETVFKGNNKETTPPPNTVGKRYIDIACSNSTNTNEKKWTEIKSGTTEAGRRFTIYYGEITGNDYLRNISTLTNSINPDNTFSSRKIQVLLNCKTKQLFYMSDFSYEQHWAKGNAVSRQVSTKVLPFTDREEQIIGCNHNLKVSDPSINKEWDAMAAVHNRSVQQDNDEKSKEDVINAKNEVRFKNCDKEFTARSLEKITNKYNGEVTTRRKFATQFFPTQNNYQPIPKFGSHIPLIWHITLLQNNYERVGDPIMMYCVTDKDTSKVIGIEPYSR